jgi:hypothetical protein
MNPYNANRKLAMKIQPHWYQTNASLSQPPTTAAERPVREYVTNVSWREVGPSEHRPPPPGRTRRPNRSSLPNSPAPTPPETCNV